MSYLGEVPLELGDHNCLLPHFHGTSMGIQLRREIREALGYRAHDYPLQEQQIQCSHDQSTSARTICLYSRAGETHRRFTTRAT